MKFLLYICLLPYNNINGADYYTSGVDTALVRDDVF